MKMCVGLIVKTQIVIKMLFDIYMCCITTCLFAISEKSNVALFLLSLSVATINFSFSKNYP